MSRNLREDVAVSETTRLEIVKKIQEEATKKVTSRELSEELKAAGADQNGTLDSCVWIDDEERGVVVLPTHIGLVCKNSGTGRILCKAFLSDELWEILPDNVELHKFTSDWYQFEYEGFDGEMYKTPAEALGKLYLWCLENGHCPVTKEKWNSFPDSGLAIPCDEGGA